VTDPEFDRLCEANSFGAVARNEFPLVPRAMLKALVDAAVSTEILKLQERIKRLEEGGDKAILNSYLPDRLAVWTKAKEAKL
jgi:hypothetical protein